MLPLTTECFDLYTRPGAGRWRRVATNLTFQEAVRLIGSVTGPRVDYWLHDATRPTDEGEASDP